MEYWYLCLIGLAAQALFIFLEKRKDYVKAVAFKALASLSFLGLGIASSALCSNSAFARLIVIGLALGVAGDALLNLRFVLDKAADKVFLAGIAAFLAGHVLYLAAQVSISSHLPAALAIGLAVAAGLLAWILRTVEAKRAFKVFGVAYIGAVVLMTAVAGGNIEGKGGPHVLHRSCAFCSKRRGADLQHLHKKAEIRSKSDKSYALLHRTAAHCIEPSADLEGRFLPIICHFRILRKLFC